MLSFVPQVGSSQLSETWGGGRVSVRERERERENESDRERVLYNGAYTHATSLAVGSRLHAVVKSYQVELVHLKGHQIINV